jgi:predicted aspartyl protease
MNGQQVKKRLTATAVWDTGATHSMITKETAQRLELTIIDTGRVVGVNSSTIADIALISIGLPNGVLIPNKRVIISSLGGQEDMLIGMDIIRLGDFSISNANRETLFSFAIPSLPEQIDLVKKAGIENEKNGWSGKPPSQWDGIDKTSL